MKRRVFIFLKKAAYVFFKEISLLFFPCCCTHCKKLLDRRTIFCDTCKDMIRPIVSGSLQLTRTRSMKVIALSAYRDPIRLLILAKRWSDIQAGAQLGQLLWDMTIVSTIPADLIVPVPLHWSRYASRGFNQAEEMSRVLARNKGIPMVKLIKRVKRTKFQAGLAADERQTNLQEAFELTGKNLERYYNKHILLVDDLLTTGSTIKEAARVLLAVKPLSITVVVAARVV